MATEYAPRLKEARRSRAVVNTDKLPPHNQAVERAALACVLEAADQGSLPETDALLSQLRPALFYCVAERDIFFSMTQLRMEEHACDRITLATKLKVDKAEGAIPTMVSLHEFATSVLNFPEYLRQLRELALRRWTLDKSAKLGELASADALTADKLQDEFAELYDKSQRIGGSTRQRLKVWRVADLLKYEPPPHLKLVGGNEINMGYEGVCVVAGPGSSGKSLCVASLALGGAIGSGLWMGRKIHRRFKTLIVQAENGTGRLKGEVTAMIQNHPKYAEEIGDSVFFTDPPEGGLPFHHPDFRSAIRRAIDEYEPDLVVIDPWSQVAAEDAAKEVVDKLNEIRSCFPAGEKCPGLLIIAHTKKPRPEDVRKGRGLTYMVSGSIALPNTARCVYVLLPWSDDMVDDRLYFACPKLNDGEMYAPTVWRRRFGTFFEHDEKTDACEWGRSDEDDGRRAITEEQLRECFDGKTEMFTREIVKQLKARFKHSDSTCYRALSDSDEGYLRAHLMRSGTGRMKLKNPEGE